MELGRNRTIEKFLTTSS